MECLLPLQNSMFAFRVSLQCGKTKYTQYRLVARSWLYNLYTYVFECRICGKGVETIVIATRFCVGSKRTLPSRN